MLVYDIEVYPNLFLVCFQNPLDNKRYIFEISPWKDNRKELYFFLKSCKEDNVTLVGFNNLEYDWLILRKFIRIPKKKQQELNNLIFLESQKVINTRMFDFNPEVKQLDLRKIHHYDNVAKMTSLKLLEFNMGMESIEDLPYPFDKELTRQERDEIISYCWNDVDATSMFYEHSKSKIKFRERMSEIYDVNFTNANDVKIGETILLKALAKGWNKEEREIKKLRTHREFMKVEDIILPYITFNSVEFNTLLDWWKTKTIYQTKGQFSELDLDDVEPLLEYCDNTLKKGRLKKLNILYKNMQFDFGTGGIHGYSRPGLWVSDDEYDLILVDVN